MNWKERLLEAIVEQKRGTVHVKTGGGNTVTRRRVGPVTLPSGDTRTGMQSHSTGSNTPDDAQSERAKRDRREFAANTKDALRRGPVTATTTTTTKEPHADYKPIKRNDNNTETTTTKIVPTGRGGRRTTKTTRRGTGPYTTKHSER